METAGKTTSETICGRCTRCHPGKQYGGNERCVRIPAGQTCKCHKVTRVAVDTTLSDIAKIQGLGSNYSAWVKTESILDPPEGKPTYCVRNHPQNAETSFFTRGGKRVCRECSRARERKAPTPEWSRCLRGHVLHPRNCPKDDRGKLICSTCKKYCPSKHRMTPDSLIIREDPNGGPIVRECRLCRNRWAREQYRARTTKAGKQPRKTGKDGMCIRGHEQNEENLYVSPGGVRICKPCRNITRKLARKRAKEANS